MKPIYVELLKYLSRVRRAEIAATECKTLKGVYADVLSIETKGVYEYEIKASTNDIHNDKYKKKHGLYAQFNKYKRSIPQYMFFVLPATDCVPVYNKLVENGYFNKKYGIIIYDSVSEYPNFTVAKNPHRLNTGHGYNLRKEVTRRSSQDFSDLCKEIDNLKQIIKFAEIDLKAQLTGNQEGFDEWQIIDSIFHPKVLDLHYNADIAKELDKTIMKEINDSRND